MGFMSDIDEENKQKEVKEKIRKLAESVGLKVEDPPYDGWENMFVQKAKSNGWD